MTTEEFITELFCRVDEAVPAEKHSQGNLYPSEVITLGLLYALKGTGSRAFWRWLVRDYRPLFPNLGDRTRLFRLFVSHEHYLSCFMVQPTLIGVIDSYGIEFIHPIRQGRSDQQIGKKGKSNKRWIVGGKLCYVLNRLGLVVSWRCDTANVYDGSAFQDLVDEQADEMVVFSDMGFAKKDWHPTNLRLCKAGEWNSRMLVETVLSMLTYICDFKRSRHKVWDHFHTKLSTASEKLFRILR